MMSMNRELFFNTLRNGLERGNMRPEIIEEIICDFEEHFMAASESGASEEEICAELGDPAEIARQYAEELSGDGKNEPQGNNGPRPGVHIHHGHGGGNIFGFDLSEDMGRLGESLGDLGQQIGRIVRDSLDSAFDGISIRQRHQRRGRGYYRDEDGFATESAEAVQTFDASAVRNLGVELKNADVRVVSSGDSQITVEFNKGRNHPAVSVTGEDGNVMISDSFDGSFRRGGKRESVEECEIRIPSAYAGKLFLKTVSGDIEARGITNASAFKSISGDLTLTDCSGEISTNCVSGDLRLRNVNITGGQDRGIMISTTSGDIDIDGFKADGETEIKTGSGDVSVFEAECRMNIRTGSGDIEVESSKGDISVSTGSGGITVSSHSGNVNGGTGSGDITISTDSLTEDCRVHTASGNLKLYVREIKANTALSSNAGDIYVKAPSLMAELAAITSLGNIRLKLGEGLNLKFDIDADEVRNRMPKQAGDAQRPQVPVTLKARRGRVMIEEL